MKQFLLTTLCLAVVTADAADDIPDRPEKLKFPALKYEPPTGADYRVQL